MKQKIEEQRKYLDRLESSWSGDEDSEYFEGEKINFPEAIDEAKEKLAELEAQGEQMVEIARSFSFKLNTGNYESRDFFCSQKAECKRKDEDEVSDALYDFCKASVIRSVNAYKRAEEKEKNAKNKKVEDKEKAKESAELELGEID